MRKKIVAGNWKMNMTYHEGLDLIKYITALYDDRGSKDVEVIICPSFIHLNICAALTEVENNIFCGAQNVASEKSGAFTGEVSAEMLKSIGVDYVIVGHSERRQYYGESNEVLEKKLKLVLENNLNPIYCVGETLAERENGTLFDIIKNQLTVTLSNVDAPCFNHIVIAYEPVWAIGTGLNASPEQAQEMHKFIRKEIENIKGKDVADNISILYGGSCKPSNAKEIFAQADVDGGLIGGASLNVSDFIQIINSY
ncbi:MAG: triose-phosphate isomerase [Bacteroidota bacterium]